MQAVIAIESLPESGVQAAAEFYCDHIASVEQALAGDASALAIVLPPAPIDHDDWRRALARDLGRAHSPRRVNVIGASDESTRDALLAYLRDAPGVTGQYLAGHE